MVWRSWTKPDLIGQWYGPGVETIIHRFDLRPGGEWRNEMKWGDKSDLSKMVFQEVVPQEWLVWLHSSCDSDWNVAASQMMPDWPRVLLTTVRFTAQGGGTALRLSQVPVEASAAEIACFAQMMAGMDKGWGSGFGIIETLLADLQAGA